MVESMFLFVRTLWKKQCKINQAQKIGTLDSRIQEKSHKYCRQLQKEIWKLHVRDRHLIWQPKYFFQNRSIQQILAWEKCVNNALKHKRDARQAMISPPSEQTTLSPRIGIQIGATTIINTTKRLKQMLLPFSPYIHTSTSVRDGENPMTITQQSMNMKQRRELSRQNRQIQQHRQVQTTVQTKSAT